MSVGSGGKAAGVTSDKAIEMWLGELLRCGVILAALVVFAGGVWYVAKAQDTAANYRTFRGEPVELRHVTQIVHEAISLEPGGLIQLGLLLLIATPVARVVFSVVGFAMERDWMYVVFTLIVLATLLYSLTSTALAARQ
jgi:uncharacterized membrane protein